MLQINLSDSLQPSVDTSETNESNLFLPVSDSLYDVRDSTFILQDTLKKKIDTESVFEAHNLKVDSISPIENNPLSNDWITIHLIIALGLIAWVRAFYNKRLKIIAMAFLSERNFSLVSREGNLFKERIAIPLLIGYLISMSLFIYQLLHFYQAKSIFGFDGLKLFSIIMILVLVYWVFKYLLIYFLGTVFKNYAIALDYQLTNFIFTLIMGIILLPVVVIAVYFPSAYIIYLGIILLSLSFLYRVLREVAKGFIYTKFSTFYKLLYLCTFEILPIIVFMKLVMSVLI